MPISAVKGLGALWLSLVLAVCANAQDVPLYEDLGDHHYEIRTAEPRAQRYFDQGLRLYYAFNHFEASRAFTEATRIDPDCAMCYWGIAISLGPNINAPMDGSAVPPAWEATQKAVSLSGKVSERERLLISALENRYQENPPEDRSALDQAWADALIAGTKRFPEDNEIASLAAEALMDLSPWDYWTRDSKPREHTQQILALLEGVLDRDPDHPGANHFYIHAVEAVDPQRALVAAERLAGLMPGAGHLVHMPGHIYIRVGRYEDAIEANRHAIHADETYIRDQRPETGVYTLGYRPHNYDFLAFAASMIGREEMALETAEELARITPQDLLTQPGMTFMQHHYTRHLQMKVRFGKWDAILDEPAPSMDAPHARAMWHYARGRALSAKGNTGEAAEELARLREYANDPELASLKLEFNKAGDVLAIAVQVLEGHLAVAKGDLSTAIDRLRDAARLEDGLTYGEPPDWSVPVREELGWVLMQAGRKADAERVFREDLERFPRNVWSMRGLEALDSASRSESETPGT
jgi:tetratricopeptide (TPR) repeat protein